MKTVLIVGASRGLGREFVRQYRRDGWNVIATARDDASLAALRAPLDAFFEKVTVNDPRPEYRRNRLALLARVRAAMDLAADFSQIEG